MSALTNREYKELERLQKKSGYSKLTQSELRRVEKLEGLLKSDKSATQKDKWVEDRKSRKINIIPKSEAQALTLQSLKENKVTVASGSSGSGKTAVVCWNAANDLADGLVKKIYITRPNTPLGDRHNGFRAGELFTQKLYGYHLPMIEYLSDVFGRKAVDMQIGDPEGFIQIVDFEALRGQTFGRNENDSCWVICDESQLLMSFEVDCLFTRIGKYAKVCLTGDPSVHQRENTNDSGLVYLEGMVKKFNIPDIGFVKYRIRDICRSDFVYDYLIAMQKYRNLDVE